MPTSSTLTEPCCTPMAACTHDAFSSSVEAVMGHPLSIDGVPVHGSTDTGILRDAFRHAAIADEVWQPRLEEILVRMRKTVLEQPAST